MRGALCCLSATLLIGCSGPSRPSGPNGAREELENYRSQFAQAVGSSYRVTVQNACFCPPEATEPVRMTVRNGAIIELARVVDGAAVRPEIWETYSTIDEVFGEINRGLSTGAQRVVVEYDSRYGYPRDVLVDYQMAADNFVGFKLSNLEVLR